MFFAVALETVTLAEALKAAGYATGLFGNWHLSGEPNTLPTQQGFEMQVNNHQPVFPGDSGDAYIENKKTGSLYGVRNTYKALARDNEWTTLRLHVQGPRVRIHVNGTLVVGGCVLDQTQLPTVQAPWTGWWETCSSDSLYYRDQRRLL